MNYLFGRSILLVKSILLSSFFALSAHAAITPVGDVSPSDPETWTGNTIGYIGNTSDGSLTVNLDSDLNSGTTYLGNVKGVSGEVTIDGPGSTWTNSSDFYIGYYGNGTLNIKNSGNVRSYAIVSIGLKSGSMGTVYVDGAGSLMDNKGRLDVDNGILSITAGGVVNSGYALLGNSTNPTGGNVIVDGPGSTWTNNGKLQVGYYGGGMLNITGGGAVSCTSCYLGFGFVPNSACGISVDGIGSTFSSSTDIRMGKGKLNISHGANVSADATYILGGPNAAATISFGANGGTLSTNSLLVSPNQLSGAGQIVSHGLVSDIDLTFDANHELHQTIMVNNVAIDLSPNASGILGAGFYGNGSLTIRNGKKISSLSGSLGNNEGSKGIATVDGIGSTWTMNYALTVGYVGKGILKISDGGAVSNNDGNLGYFSGAKGSVVTVDGNGSTWINNGNLGVVNGTLNITGGGKVTARLADVKSLMAIDVGTGSSLTVTYPYSEFANEGTVRILAGASPSASHVFSPIAAPEFLENTGIYQAVGGTWNLTTHEFTVSAALQGDSGVPVGIDRLTVQRVLINDGASHWALGASFASTAASSLLSFTATVISDGPLDALKGMLPGDGSILGAWNLASASGYTAGDPIYLSFKDGIGGGYSSQNMHVWSYDGTKWSEFTADDLTYNGAYASFTTTALGRYAVTVPEPGMLVLLACGIGGLWIGNWRRKKL